MTDTKLVPLTQYEITALLALIRKSETYGKTIRSAELKLMEAA